MENNDSGKMIMETDATERSEQLSADGVPEAGKREPSADDIPEADKREPQTDDIPELGKREPQTGNEKNEENAAAKRQFVIRVTAIVLAVLGVIMLICGIALRNLDQESRKVPDKAQMPEEYIDEFFSDEGRSPSIEDYIEPEA